MNKNGMRERKKKHHNIIACIQLIQTQSHFDLSLRSVRSRDVEEEERERERIYMIIKQKHKRKTKFPLMHIYDRIFVAK